MPLRAVLFDLWETLIHDTPEHGLPRRAWRNQQVRDVLARHGFEAEAEPVQGALDKASTALSRLHETGRDLDSPGRARMLVDELVAELGRRPPDSALAELEDVITAMPLELAPFVAPFAVEAVSGVKERGLATALVCNAGFTTAPVLRTMLEHYGLMPHLDVLVFSDELQVAKPDRRIFQRALDGLGLAAAECAFVGDNPYTDIHGALSAGLFAVQVGSKVADGVTPDARIDGLDKLIPLLEARHS